MREIIFDVETTGLGAETHRITEIGAVEVINRIPTGNTFQKYINPEREVDVGAARITGQSWEKLKNEPVFKEVAQEFINFVGDAVIVAHNAPFDMGFINAELTRNNFPIFENEVVDTLTLARTKFPGARASLDALCQRFEVSLEARTFHGALLDSQLLAEVYVHLTGGLQPDFLGEVGETNESINTVISAPKVAKAVRNFPVDEGELAYHRDFVEKELANSIWYK